MDRLLRWIRDIEKAKFFDVQNVANYYWTYPEEKWNLAGMTIAPPFDFFSTRYEIPKRVYSEKSGWFDLPENSQGGEVIHTFRVVDRVPQTNLSNQVLLSENQDLQETTSALLVPDAKWHYDIHMFIVYGREVNPPTRWFMAVDEAGRVPLMPDGRPAFWMIDNLNEHGISVMSMSFFYTPLLALTFLHCRNVEIIPPPPATKKRLPRKIKFESRYHRLKVNAIGQKRQPGGGKTGISQAYHIVRGHFREYGSDFSKGKLFGKYSGRYWVAAHFKGDSEVGVVDKDYDIVPPPAG